MRAPGRIQHRLAIAIVLTALIPLLGAIYLANIALRTTSERFFRPEVGARLDEALGLYQELARAQKTAMRAQATALATRPAVVEALAAHDDARLQEVLRGALSDTPELVSLTIEEDGRKRAAVDRGRPPDAERELTLEVRRPLGAGREPAADEDDDAFAVLVATFSADKAIYDGRDRLSDFVETYGKIAERRKADERTYLLSFALLLGLTIALAIGVGTLLARTVSARIERLAEATRQVGAGDLATRVAEGGNDEVSDLARGFNRMLTDLEANRVRIEYLQRIGAWQEMARRLAHEIKNPLTPIQLAVEEVHQRYAGGDAAYKKALDATLEVVQAEVGTLRRLVSEFSSFARLPRALLEASDLAAFLKEQSELPLLALEGADSEVLPRVDIAFDVPKGECKAYLDKQMLRRVLINLLRNSAHAIRDQGRSSGRIVVRLHRNGDYWLLDVDDDGPGVPLEERARIFDPYVTSRADGTGLGLAIVKKVVVEHGGIISAMDGSLGGARMRLTIPVLGTKAGEAALSAPETDPLSTRDLPSGGDPPA